MMADHGHSDKLITIYGGSGFIGRNITRVLAKQGYRIRAAVRRPDLAGHLQPMGDVGQIHAVQANLRDRDSVMRAAEGSFGVINLPGILYESGRQSFEAVQGKGPGYAAEAAAAAGAQAMVHVSAIGADPKSEAKYARTKAEGEAAVLQHRPDAVILRPSIVFGPEDDFFNRFGAMARISPFLPLIGGGKTRFQPVWVGDVAEAAARAIDGDAKPGTVYELGGPEILDFKELMQRVLEMTGRSRFLLSIPTPIAKLQGAFFGLLPKPPLTLDQVRLLEHDNVVSAEAIKENRTLQGLGIESADIASVVPDYMVRFRKGGQFYRSEEGL